jgi:cytochrome c biogenesis factor
MIRSLTGHGNGLTWPWPLRAAAVAIGILLPLATAHGAKAQSSESSAITSLWKSAASSVGSQIGSTAAGWAMSAIGISNSTDQALADLSEIIDLLQQIQAELSAIQTDFEDLKCEQAQNAEGLTNAITIICCRQNEHNHLIESRSSLRRRAGARRVAHPCAGTAEHTDA